MTIVRPGPNFHTNYLAAATRAQVQICLLALALGTSFIWAPAYELYFAATTLALSIFALIVTPPTLLRPQLNHPAARLVFSLLAALAAMCWVRAITSDIPALSLLQAGFYSLPFLITWVILTLPTPTLPKLLASAITCILIILIIGAPLALLIANDPNYFRARWPLLDANHLAMIMNAGIFFALGLARTRPWRYIGWILALACLIVLILTASRGGLVGLIAGLIMLALTTPNLRARFKWAYVVWPIVAIIVLSALLYMADMGRTTTLSYLPELITDPHDAMGTRPDFWLAVLRLILERPYSGYGTGTFPAVFPQVMTPDFLTSGYAAHNDFLQIWLELGIWGALAYIGLIVSILVITLRTRMADTTGHIQFITAAAIMAAIGVQAQIEFMLGVLPVMIIFGLALGFWLRTLLGDQMPAAPTPRQYWLGQGLGVLVILGASLSLTQLYADIRLRLADRALTQKDIAAFSNNLEQARVWSLDLYALPHLRAANFHLALLITGSAGDRLTPEQISAQLDDALQRNPYLSAAYESRGKLALYQNKSPLPDWQHGLSIDPRNANIRLGLLRYYERLGLGANIKSLLEETRKWQGLHGSRAELDAATDKYLGR